MPAAPVDSLGLKGRRIRLLVLGLILLIIYCAALSNAVFDFSKTRAATVKKEYHPASQELRI